MNFKNNIYQELKSYFEEVLQKSIAVEAKPNPTFLEISGFPHYEDVISNWYAFFFDTSGKHGFATLFSQTLTQIINDSKQFKTGVMLNTCNVHREKYIKEKRIDLLLYDEVIAEGNSEIYRNAIIIENKINAGLYNDLDFYYNSIQADEAKVGVVMTLNQEKNIPATYINITHSEFLDKVAQNIGKYLLKSNDKYLLLLKDVIQQVQSFTQNNSMKETVRFYFEHAQKINELAQVRTSAIDAVFTDLNIALQGTGFGWARRYPESLRIKFEDDSQVSLILTISRLFEEAHYEIELWLSGEYAAQWTAHTQLRENIKLMSAPEKFNFNKEKTGQQWALIGKQVVTIDKKLEAIQSFYKLIAQSLETQWKPFINEMLIILKNE